MNVVPRSTINTNGGTKGVARGGGPGVPVTPLL